jgi:hypothetical protein
MANGDYSKRTPGHSNACSPSRKSPAALGACATPADPMEILSGVRLKERGVSDDNVAHSWGTLGTKT